MVRLSAPPRPEATQSIPPTPRRAAPTPRRKALVGDAAIPSPVKIHPLQRGPLFQRRLEAGYSSNSEADSTGTGSDAGTDDDGEDPAGGSRVPSGAFCPLDIDITDIGLGLDQITLEQVGVGGGSGGGEKKMGVAETILLSGDDDSDGDGVGDGGDGTISGSFGRSVGSEPEASICQFESDEGDNGEGAEDEIDPVSALAVSSGAETAGPDESPRRRPRRRLVTKGELMGRARGRERQQEPITLCSDSDSGSDGSAISGGARPTAAGAGPESEDDLGSFIVHDSDGDNYVYQSSSPDELPDLPPRRRRRARSSAGPSSRPASPPPPYPSDSPSPSPPLSERADGALDRVDRKLLALIYDDAAAESRAMAALRARLAEPGFRQKFSEKWVDLFDRAVTGGRLGELAGPAGGVRVRWSGRLTTTAGRARVRRSRFREVGGPAGGPARAVTREAVLAHAALQRGYSAAQLAAIGRFRPDDLVAADVSVELSVPVLAGEPRRVVETVVHECCHLATMLLSRQFSAPHRRNFLAWAGRAAAAFPGVVVETYHRYQLARAYAWACWSCGTVFRRTKRTLSLERDRCRHCLKKWAVELGMVHAISPFHYRLHVGYEHELPNIKTGILYEIDPTTLKPLERREQADKEDGESEGEDSEGEDSEGEDSEGGNWAG